VLQKRRREMANGRRAWGRGNWILGDMGYGGGRIRKLGISDGNIKKPALWEPVFID
jgi:hypothetical protein